MGTAVTSRTAGSRIGAHGSALAHIEQVVLDQIDDLPLFASELRDRVSEELGYPRMVVQMVIMRLRLCELTAMEDDFVYV